MAHNTCSGVNNNVFGPPQQTLFLGCSIASFSVNVGWNEQVGELTVQLAQDPCEVAPGGREKIYYDYLLNPQTTTAADPGFVYPNIGAPVYFRVGDFEWSGIVQSYEEQGSVGGKPLYTVKLIDPRQILEGTQLIVGEYAGNVYSTPNLINVYGYAESFGNPAPPNVIAGATFGSPAGAFGGSLSNDNGMPWNVAKNALQVLTSAIPPIVNNYSPYGRLVFRGGYGAFSGQAPSSTIGYGIIPEELPGTSMYLLDLSELPLVPQYWRLAGTSVSLMDAISQVCADAVCDYYVEFLPTNIGGTIYKLLKVRTASRAAVPVLGAIQDFIDNAAYPVSYSKGVEMRNEVTSALIVGGNVQSIYQAYNDDPAQGNSADIICPYFGLNSLGNIIEPYQDASGIWNFEIELAQLKEQMPVPIAPNTAVISEFELLSALAGYDVWLQDGEENGYETVSALTNVESGFLDSGIAERYQAAGRPVPPAIDMINMMDDSSVPFDNISSKNSQIIYDYISTIARTYYGQKFMVRLPYTTAKADPESQANNGLAVIKTTELPTDGGWTDENSVIGLPVNSIFTDFFSLPDNRLGCYVGAAVPGDLDVSGMDPNDYWVTQNQDTGQTWVYVRAQTEPEIVYVDRESFYSPRVVVSLSSPILSTLPEDYMNSLPNHMAAFSAFYRNKSAAVREYVKNIATQGVAAQSLWDDFPPRANMITAAAVPILSTVQTYGPWVSPLPAYGITKMERDDGLVPWEYGSTANMNAAGQTRALNDTASAMQYAEMGQITVPGYPVIPLGAELGAYDAGIFGGGFHLFETRTSTTATDDISGQVYNVVDGEQWVGLYGPNITSIGVEFGLGQVTTSYQMRTFTPSFGRFSKINAERMKKFGQQNLRSQKLFRLANLNQARLGASQERQRILGKMSDVKAKRGRARSSNSPHEVLVAQDLSWVGGTKRSVVASEEASELNKEFNEGFASKAFMSLDGLVRPVSVDGGGGLSRFANTQSGNQFTIPVGPLPPMLIPDTGDQSILHDAYKLDIYTDYLNPFITTADSGNMHGESLGHDIAVVGHGSSPDSTINLYTAGTGVPVYPDNARIIALRGPLVLKGWGYATDGKPIPNEADDEDFTVLGQYENDNVTDRFMDNWLRKSDSWPAGPVDLRFDKRRGVWVSPPAHRMVVGLALSTIEPFGSGYCQLAEGDALFDSEGRALAPSRSQCWCAPKFRVQDPIGRGVTSGAFFIGYYEPSKDLYWVMEQYNVVTTTTTTTTWNPSLGLPCTGECKWNWNAGTNRWDLAINGCGSPTTSTTASPGASTTTTACNCPSTTSGPSSTAAPTTTSTTPAPPTCKCAYPSFCGVGDQCTYTNCQLYSQTPPQPPACSTTVAPTTTPTPATTTTQWPTTCNGQCYWECNWAKGQVFGGGAFGWFETGRSEDYNSAYTCGDFIMSCGCEAVPTGNLCSSGDCKTTVTNNTERYVSPATNCSGCDGSCTWYWFTSDSYPDGGYWAQVTYGWGAGYTTSQYGFYGLPGYGGFGACRGGYATIEPVSDCNGVTVTKICNFNGWWAGYRDFYNDIIIGGTGPGGSEIIDSFGCGCPYPTQAGDICTPTITTCESINGGTTTPGPCTSGCIWSWNDGLTIWELDFNYCLGACVCPTPIGNGVDSCDVRHMNCIASGTTTTSTLPPSTTTTTTACPTGLCSLICQSDGGGGYTWQWNPAPPGIGTCTDNWDGNCTCRSNNGLYDIYTGCPCYPHEDGTIYLPGLPYGCVNGLGSNPCTALTTTSTTTTTTSTTTTCAPAQCTFSFNGTNWVLDSYGECEDCGPAPPTEGAESGDTACVDCCDLSQANPTLEVNCDWFCIDNECTSGSDVLAWLYEDLSTNCRIDECYSGGIYLQNCATPPYPIGAENRFPCNECVGNLYNAGCAPGDLTTTTPAP